MNGAEAQLTVMAHELGITNEALLLRLISLAWDKYQYTRYSEPPISDVKN